MTSTTPQQNGGIKSKSDSQNMSNNSPQSYFKPSSLLYNAANLASTETTTPSMPNGYINPSSAVSGGIVKTTTMQTKVTPVATLSKQDIDFHLENFIMNRKIALNGGNELRIDDRNISLHLNNPFVSNYAGGQTTHYGTLPKTMTHTDVMGNGGGSNGGLMRNYFDDGGKTTINDNYSNTLTRPKRPHSIAVSSVSGSSNQLSDSNLDLNASIYQNPSVLFKSPSMRTKQELSYFTPPSPAGSLHRQQQQQQQPSQQQQQIQAQQKIQPIPPAVPARRSQSIPRQSINQSLPNNGTMTVARPRSLDRCNGIAGQPPPVAARRMVQSHYATPTMGRPNNGGAGGMRQSATFHGQPLHSDIYKFPPNNPMEEAKKRTERPMSFAYGTVPEQVYLEHQLRLYTEQLRTITEGVRRCSEQSRILQEMKRQQQIQPQLTPKMSNSRSEPRSLKQSDLAIPNEGAQTPSHQLKIFLDSIRSSMREPPGEQPSVLEQDDEGDSDDDNSAHISLSSKQRNKVPSPAPPGPPDTKTPSDQLRHFLDAIRSNQEPVNPIYAKPTDIIPKISAPTGLGSANSLRPKLKELENLSHSPNTSESFSKVTDNMNLLNQQLEKLSTNSNLSTLRTTKHNMDQVLDNFYQMASHLKTTNSVEYLRRCQELLKHTTEQIRYLNAQKYNAVNGGATSGSSSSGNNNNNNNNGTSAINNGSNGGACFYDSHDDSSCSTTPGSIREAVQHLLAQPRNGFQIMDDRMQVFIDILEAQEKFSQVCVFK